jgi:prolycopene isomerase
MKYDVIIIGAGVAGLVSALKLSRAGKKVLVLEQQHVPGGFASSFKRNGFIFESAVHCVDALGEKGEIREFLKETGIDKKVAFIELKNFCRIIYPEHDFVLDFSRRNFIAYLKSSFPQESRQLDKFFSGADAFYKQIDSFRNSVLPLALRMALSPFLYRQVIQASCLTAEQLIAKYIRDEKLRGILSEIWRYVGLSPRRLGAFYFLLVQNGYLNEPTAYIKGGFNRLFTAMVEEIQRSGSRVQFNTLVNRIITDGSGRIKAVATKTGEEFQANAVIANANAIDTLTNFLDDDALKERYKKKLSGMQKSVSALQLYLGLDVPAKTLGMNEFMFSIHTSYDNDEDFRYSLAGDYQRCGLQIVDHAQIDPTLVPEGKGNLLIMAYDTYSRWQDLEEAVYKRRKEEAAGKLIQRAEKYLPGLSGHIEVMEVATPRTMQRFTLSPQGAIYGFAQTLAQSGIKRLSQETLVKGLFLAGAWTRPGHGVHGCFISGIDAADLALQFLG